jgi:transposase InsO family protein
LISRASFAFYTIAFTTYIGFGENIYSAPERDLIYGYRRIRALLAREGWTVSRNQVQRIRRREGLKVRSKPKKIPRRGVPTGLPTQAAHRHHVWTWDFIFDRTENGGTLKMMTLLDECSRQFLAIQVERQITAAQVLVVLQAVIRYGGARLYPQ